MTGRTLVKLCGLRHADDVDAALVAGADMVGFVLAPSSRQLSAERARDLAIHARDASGSVRSVAVVVGDDAEELADLVRRAETDMVQLARGATPQLVTELRARTGLPVIAVFHVAAAAPDPQLVAGLARAADWILYDAFTPLGGGGGEPFDHGLLARAVPAAPWGLAGGLAPGTVGLAVRTLRPGFVDTSSGIESGGAKNPALMRAFVDAVRAADAASDSPERLAT